MLLAQLFRDTAFGLDFAWLQCSECSLGSSPQVQFRSIQRVPHQDDAEIGCELCEFWELAKEQLDLYGFVRLLGFPFQTGPGEGFVGLPRGDHREGGILHADAAGHETIFQ